MPEPTHAPPTDEAVLFDGAPGEFAVYVWKNLDLVIWDAPASGAGVRRLTRIATRRTRETGRCSVVHIVTERGGLLDAEARSEFGKMSQLHTTNIGGIAIVLEGSGFWASSVRAAITGVLLVAGHHYTARMFSDLGVAARWLPAPHLKLTGTALDPAVVLTVLESARAKHP